MRLSWLLVIPTVFAVAIQKRDADFDQVRTKMNKDASGRRGDDSGKYFRESRATCYQITKSNGMSANVLFVV